MTLIGKNAKVIAPISGDHCGEVMVDVGIGTEVYIAYPADKGASFPTGDQVIIVDEAPGRTVYVTAR